MPGASLEQQSEGTYRVSGEMSFATVTSLLLQSRSLFAGQSAIQIDLASVTHADSAGLSLLIEWLRQSRQQGLNLRYLNVPAQLSALASISDVDQLLNCSA